jgi:hypothetical protein
VLGGFIAIQGVIAAPPNQHFLAQGTVKFVLENGDFPRSLPKARRPLGDERVF